MLRDISETNRSSEIGDSTELHAMYLTIYLSSDPGKVVLHKCFVV